MICIFIIGLLLSALALITALYFSHECRAGGRRSTETWAEYIGEMHIPAVVIPPGELVALNPALFCADKPFLKLP